MQTHRWTPKKTIERTAPPEPKIRFVSRRPTAAERFNQMKSGIQEPPKPITRPNPRANMNPLSVGPFLLPDQI